MVHHFILLPPKIKLKNNECTFLTVDGEVTQVKRMLKRQGIPYVEKNKKVHIVGQHAFNYAQIFSTAELNDQ